MFIFFITEADYLCKFNTCELNTFEMKSRTFYSAIEIEINQYNGLFWFSVIMSIYPALSPPPPPKQTNLVRVLGMLVLGIDFTCTMNFTCSMELHVRCSTFIPIINDEYLSLWEKEHFFRSG